MQFRRLVLVLSLALIIAAVTIGCGAGSTPAPTATPIPPTAVPTAVPPTQAPAAAPAAGSGGTLQDALDQVKTATSYRVDLSITGKGNFALTGAPTPEPGAEDKPVTLVNMKGEVNGKDAHFTLQGALTSFLGIDPNKSFEVISYKGAAYLKGPVPLLGASEEVWYLAPPEAASVAQPPLTPGTFLQSFGDSGINPADFKETGKETLDGASCTVFAGDKTAVVNAFSKLAGAAATQDDLNSIDNAQFNFWVCPDGYLHQIKMLIEGHDKNKPDSKGTFEIIMKASDFNTDLKITPPADAKPLTLPTKETGAPSPTP